MEKKSSRRDFIKNASIGTLGAIALTQLNSLDALAAPHEGPLFVQAALSYDYKALEPHIDAMTMEIHYSKHHKGYIDNLNKICAEKNIHTHSVESLFPAISTMPAALRNNAGGHYNHTLFWTMMTPNGGGEPTGKVKTAIDAAFGNFNDFKTKFNEAAKSRFGSGWAWLVINKEGKLEIGSTANQDNPLMDVSELKGTPILCLDVWEHAYYLKYQNKRADYVNAFWNVVNWNTVAARLG